MEDWEKELLADHRWGRLKTWFPEQNELWDTEKASLEHERLKNLWSQVKPLNPSHQKIHNSIIALEICNWNLENSILSLCQAIGTGTAPQLPIGHSRSISDARWKQVWAYYLSLKQWLRTRSPDTRPGRRSGYETLLQICDPQNTIQTHITDMLGVKSQLKQLYVERFCLNLEYWLGGFYPEDSPLLIAYTAAVEKLETEIMTLDPHSNILEWMRLDGKRGWIEICHHKVFRRFDIQISSIGSSRWRGSLAWKGTDGRERAATLDRYLSPMEHWIRGDVSSDAPNKTIERQIWSFLGERDTTKWFLVALLVSLLKSQSIAARRRANLRLAN